MGLPSDSGRTKRIFRGNPVLILVLLAALGIRTALFVSLRPWDENVVERRILVEDARSYHDLATSVLETGTFEEFDTGFYLRTPGYPLFISGVFLVAGDRVWIVLLLQVIMDSLTALIVYALAREIGLSKRIGLIAAALYALAMVSAEYAQIGAEVEVITHSGPVRAVMVECPFYDPKKSLAAA